MYENVFQFSSRPFTTAPFVKHYFAAEAIHDSLGQARLCIDRASGPVVVVGSVGTGKSLLLAMLEEQYQSQFKVVTLGCSRLGSRQEFLQTFLFQLSLPFKGMSESEARLALIDFLKPGEQCPNGVLLLIDEAHTLGADLLDEIRLVTNFVRDGQPRVRLVMAGTNRLEDNLTDPKLESFNQRIAARCYLEKLNRDETSRYVIEHIDRLFREKLYGDMRGQFDDTGRIRNDDWELTDKVQDAVRKLWPKVNTDNVLELSDLEGFRADFLRIFGFGFDGVDYEADVSPLAIPG